MKLGILRKHQYWLWLLGLEIGLVLIAVFMLVHPEIFPMHGFTGPAMPSELPETIRLTGDSWRYISGGSAILYGVPLDDIQASYLGYCLVCGLAGGGLVAVQVMAAMVALAAVAAVGRRLGGPSCGILAGALFALNPELGAWHCAVMTESLYTSCVCINAFLALWALEAKRPRFRMAAVFLFMVLTAFLRPTGWIQLPAVLIFWSCSRVRGIRWKLALSAAIAAVFVVLAVTGGSSRIQSESPAVKLYRGEVVWQEELWRVSMPPADGYGPSMADGMRYGLRHPLASGWLVLKRLGVMALRIRPSYSLPHNLFLMAYHFPVALLGILALFLCRKSAAVWCIAAFVAAHALVVALTFNDNDGRFTLYFTPILAAAAVGAALALFKRYGNRTADDGASSSAAGQ